MEGLAEEKVTLLTLPLRGLTKAVKTRLAPAMIVLVEGDKSTVQEAAVTVKAEVSVHLGVDDPTM
jgi:hypothetical protein